MLLRPLFVLALFAAIGSSIAIVHQSHAQQDDTDHASVVSEEALKMVRDSIRIRETELMPLQENLNRENSRTTAELTAELNFINKIENRNDGTLDQVRNEVTTLRARLESLEKLEDKLIELEMDPDVAERTLEESRKHVAELTAKRTELMQPYHEEMSDLHRKYSDRSTELKELLDDVFRQKANVNSDGEQIELGRSHFSATFTYSQTTASYQTDDKTALTVSVVFVSTNRVQDRYGLFLNKYPMTIKSKNSVGFLVGDSHVQAYCQNGWKADSLEEAVDSMIDLEKLEALNPADPTSEAEERNEKPQGDQDKTKENNP